MGNGNEIIYRMEYAGTIQFSSIVADSTFAIRAWYVRTNSIGTFANPVNHFELLKSRHVFIICSGVQKKFQTPEVLYKLDILSILSCWFVIIWSLSFTSGSIIISVRNDTYYPSVHCSMIKISHEWNSWPMNLKRQSLQNCKNIWCWKVGGRQIMFPTGGKNMSTCAIALHWWSIAISMV